MSLETLKALYSLPAEKPAATPRALGFNGNDNLELYATIALRKPKIILELGTWLGQSAACWLELNPEATVICVDHWEGLTHDAWLPPGLPEEFVGENFPTLYETFQVNMWAYRDRVVPIRADTLAGLRIVHEMGVMPDVIYIDADHTYESVSAELELCREWFPGAILCGDDFNDPNFPGVRRAVIEAKLPNLISNGRCWCSEPIPPVSVPSPLRPSMSSPVSRARRSMHRPGSAKKIIWTLNIGNYAPQIRALTRPLLEGYAFKIGAEIHEITERRFPDWPVTLEKLQIYDLAREADVDWALYVDGDCCIHPDMWDVTEHTPADTVCHNGRDMANIRWKYDHYFRRDGRNIGSCNWFACASRMCLDLWHPIEDLTPEEALANIFPIVAELNYKNEDGSPRCGAEHLIDDYALSRNIARFGLKFTTVIEMSEQIGLGQAGYFAHNYSLSQNEKVENIKAILREWKVPQDLYARAAKSVGGS